MSIIAKNDKSFLNNQHQIDLLKKELKKNYKECSKNLKENHHLQTSIDTYEEYFNNIRAKIKILKGLLKQVNDQSDLNEIKREIKELENDLP